MNKKEILKAALDNRNQEIFEYQINIDNYRLAIEKINNEYFANPAMIEFKDRLSKLLEEHLTEQLKSVIIRDVIADQLAELEAI